MSNNKAGLSLTKDEAQKLLHCIPTDTFEVKARVAIALTNIFGDKNALNLLEGWLFFDLDDLPVLSGLQDNKISVEYLCYLAQKHGYRPPQSILDILNKRKPGLAAFQDIFCSGTDYAAIGSDLYQYDWGEGYYKKLTEGYLQKLIADYFAYYLDGKYGETRHFTEAIKYVKNRCYCDPNKVNPPGLNLKNGYLQFALQSSIPKFELLPHSPKYIFTHCSPVEYEPDASDMKCTQAINAILESCYQEIVFRVLGSVLDLPTVRKFQGRAIRALFFCGEGSNGKDTLREWLSVILGYHGLSAVSLHSIKNADKDRHFALYPLVTSRINWSSENAKIAIDYCETLKSIVTGEPVNVEEKHKQGFTIVPKVICVFNMNDLPALEGKQESLKSRYAVIPFNSVFTTTPDPQKPWEKQADPRLKEDKEYVTQKILPAFLNRLIKGFVDVLQYGVDYGPVEPLMDELRNASSHLANFIEDTGLIETSFENGLKTSEIYTAYEIWCIKEGLIIESDFGKKYSDPNPWDTVIKNCRQLTPRLKKIFPALSVRQASAGSIWPLNFKENPRPEKDDLFDDDELFGTDTDDDDLFGS